MTATRTASEDNEVRTERAVEAKHSWLMERGALSPNWIGALAVAWVVVFVGSQLLEPAPSNPDAASPLWAAIVETAFFAAVLAMVAGFTGRSRMGALASFAAAGVFLTMVVACPVTGHHAIGAWWYAQVAGTAALGTASLAALRS